MLWPSPSPTSWPSFLQPLYFALRDCLLLSIISAFPSFLFFVLVCQLGGRGTRAQLSPRPRSYLVFSHLLKCFSPSPPRRIFLMEGRAPPPRSSGCFFTKVSPIPLCCSHAPPFFPPPMAFFCFLLLPLRPDIMPPPFLVFYPFDTRAHFFTFSPEQPRKTAAACFFSLVFFFFLLPSGVVPPPVIRLCYYEIFGFPRP